MRARAYNNRFDLYETTSVPDGFGGFTNTVELINTSWAKIETFNIGSRDSNATEFGLLDANNALKITVRKRNDLTYNSETQYIMYRGEKYMISTSPINVNFEDNVVQFIAVKQNIRLLDNDLAKEAQAKAIALQYMIRVNEDGGSIEDYDCLVEQIKDIL